MKLIKRENYMNKLIKVMNTPDIKVITGIRRSGKSKLLEEFKNYIEENIKDNNIIHINYNLSKNDILKNQDFVDVNGFLNKFPKVELDEKKKPKNVKIFMIMDVDNTNTSVFNSYKDKSLFPKSWLKDILVPIWNDNNLEEVLNQIGYYYAKNDKQKKNYKRAFPVERGSQDLNSVEELRDKLQHIPKSNMDEFLTFCLNNCPKF